MHEHYILTTLILVVAFASWARLNPSFAFLGGQPEDEPPKEKKPWEDLLMLKKNSGGGGGSAPRPDYNIGRAAMKQAELGEDWLLFARDQFGEMNRRQDRTDALTRKVTNQQYSIAEENREYAREDRQRYKDVYQPMEDQFAEDAKNWDSVERQNKVANEAVADVRNQASVAKQSAQRSLAAAGVDPRSGRYAAVERGNDLAAGLAAGSAQNQARDRVRSQGVAMRGDAINMGRGLPSQSAGAAGLSLQAGNSAVGNNLAGNQQFMQGNSIMTQGFQGGMAGYQGQASTLQGLHNSELSAWSTNKQASAQESSSMMSGIGTMAGAAMMFMSSKDYKEDKKPVDGALEKVRDMPVEEWTYKEGIADEGRHVGPYAEDFHEATGKGDGKSIPVQDVVGLTMKATQELADKVDDLGDKVAGLGAMPSGKRGRKENKR